MARSQTQRGTSQPTPPCHVHEREGLKVRSWPRWLEAAADHQQVLSEEVPWKQEMITLFGRTTPIPRLSCWMGDPGCHYTYSGVRNQLEPWSPRVQELRLKVEEAVGCRFNSLLLNLYRDGSDKLDWHADDERELDPASPIVSLSLGAARTFRLRPRDPERIPCASLTFELGHGDLLVMDPPTQEHWLHQVPRRLRVKTPRLNLTFRVILPAHPISGAASPPSMRRRSTPAS
ncbi:MAG TPA: alpha-ketoglutarate-dependent dioxygenase AlkB [Cyanobium sp.]|nr:alpha-ketoglutarate-dependent dioxygenase AlkB [Cyanobium sp.]